MKILMISNLYPPDVVGGFEVQCASAAQGLRSHGHSVVVLTSFPRRPAPSQPYVLRRLHQPDVYAPERRHLRSPFWELEQNLLDAENVAVLLEVLEDFTPDVCYLWNLIAIGGAGLVGTLEYLGVPWVWHLGDSVPAVLCHYNAGILPLGGVMSERLTGRYIILSETVADTTGRIVDLGGRVRLIPNWVEETTLDPARSYFDGKRLRMVFAGRLTEEKGLFIVLQAAAELRRRGYENFGLDLYGRGDVTPVIAAIEDLDLGGAVVLRGWVERAELMRRLNEYDVFLSPTARTDVFGAAQMEASALGCVPLVSSVQGYSEWMVHGVHCLKAARDPASFADAVAEILDGKWDLEAIGRRGAALVQREFILEAVLPSIEEELMLESKRVRHEKGNPADAYRMALIAEALLREALMTAGRVES